MRKSLSYEKCENAKLKPCLMDKTQGVIQVRKYSLATKAVNIFCQALVFVGICPTLV